MGILDRFSLAGKNAVVTGASRGLGLSVAHSLLEAGASVAITARIPGNLEHELVRARAKYGNRVIAVACDVTNRTSIDMAIEQVQDDLGAIDIWVNNAGITYWGSTLEADPQRGWNSILDTNLSGVFNCSQAIGQKMAGGGAGTIINIGSISGFIVNRPQAQAAYNSAKAAVHHLTRSMAVELAPAGIRINAVAPGYIATEMVEDMFDKPDYKDEWIDRVPMRRAADPEEIASVVVFLASEASSFMTGAVVVADGGYTLT